MASSVKTTLVGLLFWLNFTFLMTSTKENYIIYFRQDGDKIAVNVEMDLKEKVALLTSLNPQSPLKDSVSLHDYSMNVIAFKDRAKNACYLEEMKGTSLVYQRRLLQSLRNQVLLGQAETLYVDELPLSRREIVNIAGGKIGGFCAGLVTYGVSGKITRRRRNKRDAPTRQVHRTYSHHEHLSHNYASFGHETISPQGSRDTKSHSHAHHSDPVWMEEERPVKTKPTAFDLAVARHLGRRKSQLRSFPTNGGMGSINFANANAGQINTQITSGFPGGFTANGQFSLTDANSGHLSNGQGLPIKIPLGQFSPQNNFNGQPKIHGPFFFPNGQLPSGQYFPPSQEIPSNSFQGRPETGFSSQSQVELEKNKVSAGSSAQGQFGQDISKSQVQGSASINGSFQAHAQSNSASGSSQSQVEGTETGAESSSSTNFQDVGQSEAKTKLSYDRSVAEANAQAKSNLGSTLTQTQGGRQGGEARSQSQGHGMTSSIARVGLDESDESEDEDSEPFLGKAEAQSQGGDRNGQSRSQVTGDHKGTSYSAVAQGTYGQPDDHQGPVATALPNYQLNGQSSGDVVPFPGYDPSGNLPQNGNLPPVQLPRIFPSGTQVGSSHFYTQFPYPQFTPPTLPPSIGQYYPSNLFFTLPPHDLNQAEIPQPHFKTQLPNIYPTSFPNLPNLPNLPSFPIHKNHQPTKFHPTTFNSGQSHSYLPQIQTSHLQPSGLNPFSPDIHLPDKNVDAPINKPNSGLPLYPNIPSNIHNIPNFHHQSQTHPPINIKQSLAIPNSNGFRTRVITSQSLGPVIPNPQYPYISQSQTYINKNTSLKPQVNGNVFQQRSNEQRNRQYPSRPNGRRCQSFCSHGYRILKSVKICKISVACQTN